MKRISFLLILIAGLCSCKKTSNTVTITGEIKGLGTDTILLYGMDESYDHIDTVYVENDLFTFQTKIDTITCATLLFSNQTEYPIFLDKKDQITIKGDTSDLSFLTITGNIYNEELTAFQQNIKASGALSQRSLEEKAETFIKEHRSSFTSLYLLDKYFVQKESPDYNNIKRLIEVMTGILQDKPYIAQLNEMISQAEKTEIGKYASFFSLPNVKGEKISRSVEAFRNKNLLINFWASWMDSIPNSSSNRELRDIYKSYKKSKHFAMLGISFDVDKQAWKDAIKRDTLNWEQVCDFNGMNSELTNQYAINQLPTNILLAPDGKILAKDLKGKELKKKIDECIAVSMEKEKKDKKENKKK